MYARKRQMPRHAGEQLLGGRALLGAATGGIKNLAGQLFDGQKGVDFGQVGKAALGGAAGSIPLVGGMLQNKIAGGGAQAQAPGQAGAAPGAGMGGGIGQGLMGLAQNALGMEAGGGIPHNPDLAGAPYKMRGVKLMKSGGTIDYDNGGKSGEVPGLDVISRDTQIGGPIGRPEMGYTRQIYMDGLPVSGAQAKAFIDERNEGIEGQGMPSLGDALNAAESRRARERSGRDYLGPGMYRRTAKEELQAAQKRQGASGLLGALENYNTSRGTRDYGGGGYLR